MAIRTTTTDYTNRKKDISILQYPNPSIPDAQLVNPSFSKGGRFCTGIQKTIQKYVIILLTNLNSQEKYPQFGTTLFSDLIYRSSGLDTILASQLFVLASAKAVSTIKTYQIYRNDIPADERLVSVNLINITFQDIEIGNRKQRNIGFNLKIQTEAGEVVDYVLPLPK